MFFQQKIGKDQKMKFPFCFKLIKNYFSKESKNIISQGIKINILGNQKKLSPDIKNILKKTIDTTKKNKRINVNLAINYGSKDEIVNAVKKIKKKLV